MVKRLRWSDVEMGLLGGLFIAVPIFIINLTGGFTRAAIAGLGQYVYSLIVISYNNSLCRRFAQKSIFFGTLVPTILTTVLTYILHIVIKSPEPFWSAAFAFITALPSFWALSYRYKYTQKTIWELCVLCYKWVKRRYVKKHKRKHKG